MRSWSDPIVRRAVRAVVDGVHARCDADQRRADTDQRRADADRLGHSSVAFTLDTYAHAMPGMQPDAAELLGDLVYPDLDAGDDAEEDER